MSTEGTSEARRHLFEGSGKKSKKGSKKKARLNAENEDAEDNSSVAVQAITGSDGGQPMHPHKKKSKKKEKVLEDIEQQVQGSIKKTEDKKEQRKMKRKRVKFNLETSNTSSDSKRGAEDPHEDPIFTKGNDGEQELNKPSDTTWVQKASWKSLVGETGRVSFSLGSMVGHDSGILPGGNRELASTGPDKPSMEGQPSNTVSAWIEGSSAAPLFECSSPSNGHLSLSSGKNTSKFIKKSKSPSALETLNHESVRTHVVENGLNHQSIQTHVVKNGLKRDPEEVEGAKCVPDLKEAVQSEHENNAETVCRFMRSENYEQEWLDAKRAVKDILKASRKDALKTMKMFHKKHNQ